MASLRDSVAAAMRQPKLPLLRELARTPLVREASTTLSGLPTVELVDVAGTDALSILLSPPSSRHDWSLGVAEQVALQSIIAGRKVRSAFEIGTFNGGTTRLLAESVPKNGRVVTLDLPAAAFDQTQAPRDFTGEDVGRAYTSSPAASKITQLLEDSLAFDPSPYQGQFDLVLVDGGHEYVHGVKDTETALRLLAPGGVIVWDDFEPHWHGLVRGITQTMEGRDLRRLRGTSLGIHQSEPKALS